MLGDVTVTIMDNIQSENLKINQYYTIRVSNSLDPD